MKSKLSVSLSRTKEDQIDLTDNVEILLAKIGSLIED